jgi:cytochrome c556
MKKTTAIVLGLCTSLAAGVAVSQEAGSAAVEARHHQMEMIAYNTGILGGMAKGEMDYNAEMATSAATNLHAMAMLDRATLWVEGTEQGAVEGSRAKAEIWSDPETFDAKFKALQDASAAMMEVAGTDLDGLKGGMGAIGKACGDCHDTFRGPRN